MAVVDGICRFACNPDMLLMTLGFLNEEGGFIYIPSDLISSEYSTA